MPFDLKTAQPVEVKSDGVLEPTEGFNLATAKPIEEVSPKELKRVVQPETFFREDGTVQQRLRIQTKEDLEEGRALEDVAKETFKETGRITLEALKDMPILGAFSPRQIAQPQQTAVGTILGEDRDSAFKWYASGMPTDLKSIEKVEGMSWADLIHQAEGMEELKTEVLDAVTKSVGASINPAITNLTIPDSLTKKTIENLPAELLGDAIEFVTDPAALLIAQGIGAAFKKLPQALKMLQKKAPKLYKLLTKEIGGMSKELKSAYKTLGAKPTDSATVINKKFRAASFKYHPDKVGDNPTIRAINNAYELIKKAQENVWTKIQGLYRNSKVGRTLSSQKGQLSFGKIPKNIVKKFGVTVEQVADFNLGKVADLSPKLIGELAALGFKPPVVKAPKAKAKKAPEVAPTEPKAVTPTEPTKTQPTPPTAPKKAIPEPKAKERGSVKSINTAFPNLKVSGQYIPRKNDELWETARAAIEADFEGAKTKSLTNISDESTAIANQIMGRYSQLLAETEEQVIKDALHKDMTAYTTEILKLRSEAGRAVQANALLGKMTPEGQIVHAAQTIKNYNDRIEKQKLGLGKKIPELTPEQTEEILNRMKDVLETPEAKLKARKFKDLQNFIEELAPSSLSSKIITVWKAGLLTGLKTHGLNILSTASHVATELIKDIPATFIDSIVAIKTGKRAVAFTTRGVGPGAKLGGKNAWEFLKTGYDERDVLSKYDYKKVNMGSSKAAKFVQKAEELVFRVLGAEDQVFYYAAKMHSLFEQAKVSAINNKLKGEAAKKHIDDLVMNPTAEMALQATEDSKIAVFQNETALGNLAKKFQQLGPAAEIILPFGRTPSAVATQIINYSPVGIAKTIALNMKKGKFNQRDFSQGVGRGITGTAIMGLGAWLLNQGRISLDYPKTERERELWRLEGRKANSMKVGNSWRTLQSFGPAGNVILVGAHFMQGYNETGSVVGGLAQGFPGAAKSFTEQTFLQSIQGALEVYNDPKRHAMTFVNRLASSVVPTIVKDVAMALDPNQRMAEGLVQNIMSRIPKLREKLEPRVDLFGKDVKRTLNFLESMADPTRPSKIKDDPIVNEIRRLVDDQNDIKTTRIGKKFGFKALTQKQNTKMWKASGKQAYDEISEYMSRPDYERTNDEVKTKRINKIIKKAQDEARINIAIEATTDLVGEKFEKKKNQLIKDKVLTLELFKKFKRRR